MKFQSLLRFEAMSELEFDRYRRESILEFIEQKMKAEGISREDAEKVARESFRAYLPQGLDTPNSFLYQLVEVSTGLVVGTVWYGIRGDRDHRRIYVYDIIFKPEFRGRGLGEQAMLMIEEEARERGITRMGLHVFGQNARARALYEKLGYRATNIHMLKELN